MKKITLLAAAPLTSPRDWLGSLNPGSGIPQAQGISFFTDKFFPFLIQLTLFIVFALSIIFLIIGAIMMMTSGGNKEGMAKAKNTITYALIGLALALSSAIIVSVLGSYFGTKLN